MFTNKINSIIISNPYKLWKSLRMISVLIVFNLTKFIFIVVTFRLHKSNIFRLHTPDLLLYVVSIVLETKPSTFSSYPLFLLIATNNAIYPLFLTFIGLVGSSLSSSLLQKRLLIKCIVFSFPDTNDTCRRDTH